MAEPYPLTQYLEFAIMEAVGIPAWQARWFLEYPADRKTFWSVVKNVALRLDPTVTEIDPAIFRTCANGLYDWFLLERKRLKRMIQAEERRLVPHG